MLRIGFAAAVLAAASLHIPCMHWLMRWLMRWNSAKRRGSVYSETLPEKRWNRIILR